MRISSDRRGAWCTCELGSEYLTSQLLSVVIGINETEDPIEYLELSGMESVFAEPAIENSKPVYIDGMPMNSEEKAPSIRIVKSSKIWRDYSERNRARWLDRMNIVEPAKFEDRTGDTCSAVTDSFGNRRRFVEKD
jgi:GTP-dependent phosphoenolpyruvate carboxykinase